MIGGKEYFDEHDGSGIDTDGDENDTFFGLSRHEEIYVQEDEGKHGVIEKPISDEGHLLNEIPLNSFAVVSLSSP